MLISGGFDLRGRLDFKPLLDGIKKIKTEYPNLTVYLHTGFLNEEEAWSLSQSGVDAVLVNLIKSKKVIEEVYNLKDRGYSDYIDTIRILKQCSLKVCPHIIIGLGNSTVSDEFSMVEDAIDLKVDAIVFAVFKKASRSVEFAAPGVPGDEIVRLVRHARNLSRKTVLSFGCARPQGKPMQMVEIELIKVGIDSIAFPSEKAVRYAVENKIAHTFVEKCCANL